MYMKGTGEQLRFESVGCDDERLRQQLQLESLNEFWRAVALAVIAQHGVTHVSKTGIERSSALQQVRNSRQKSVV